MKNKKEIKYKILLMISCGEPFSSWICGDFLEHEVDEEGRSLGKHYFCSRCHKKADEIIKIIEEAELKEELKNEN